MLSKSVSRSLFFARNKSSFLSTLKRSVSSYEYPNRTEAPKITRSLAPKDDDSLVDCVYTKPQVAQMRQDSFDDTKSLSPDEQKDIRQKQKSSINTKLPSSFAIETTPPSFIPPNLPRDAMTTPETIVTKLDNGIRVASQETYGQVSTFGLLSNCGSRLEQTSGPGFNSGVNHLMELLAFSGTPSLNSVDFQTTLDNLGGVSFASSSREQFLYCIDVLRPNVRQAMGLLRDVILEPRLDDLTVEEMKRVIEFQWMDMVPEMVLSEGLQLAGYSPIKGEIQQLGKPHLCPLESLPYLTADVVKKFRHDNLLNPHNLVVAGSGLQHDELVSMAEENFGHLSSTTEDADEMIVASNYTGGSHRQILPTPDGFTRVALAFPTGGWHSSDLVPACVLQTLLGGGSSFSAGGPGKGMYSRLYRQVLNRYYWAESCEAFTSFHNESGLLGISGSAPGTKAGDMTRVLAENMMRLAVEDVDDEELDRAKNMLKNNVLTQLESRLVLFEDIGRQILTYGKREGTAEMCEKIDAVDKKVIRELVQKSVTLKPTLVTVGDDVSYVPAFEDVERWFQSLP